MPDYLIVNRDNTNYQLAVDEMSKLRDTDLLLVNRDGVTYKMPGSEVPTGSNSLNPSIPPFVSKSGPKTQLTNTDGKIEFSLDNTTYQSSVTIEPDSLFYVEWTDAIDSAVQGQTYTSEIETNYLELGIQETLEIKISSIDKIPDPFSFDTVLDVIAGSTTVSNPVAMLGSINAPTYIWGATDSTSAQINIAELGWISIPASPTSSVKITSKDQVEVRHVALNGALTDTTTTINIGLGTGTDEFESADFVTTNFNSYIIKPTITSPTANEIVSSITPTLTGSSFASVGGLIHASTDWQVASDIDFTNIIWESLSDTTNLESVVSGNLGVEQFYTRVRYRDTLGAQSEYSDPVVFDTPFGSGPNATVTTTTNMEINSSTTVTLQPGTYRFTIWGAGGGGGANGTGGGGGGSVSKTLTYSSVTNAGFTIGTAGEGGKGGCHEPNKNCGPGALGGSPGGGNGATGDWRGGAGGGYSTFDGMTAGGGGGGGSQRAGAPTGGGQPPSEGSNTGNGYGGRGEAGENGSPGSSGSNGGGGGAGSHQTSKVSNGNSSGNGGANGGSYDSNYPASFGTAANVYNSTAYNRVFGASGSPGGARIERL